MRNECDRRDIWLLIKEEPRFKKFRDAMDTRRKALFRHSVVITPKHTDPVTPDVEKLLWDSGVLKGKENRKTILRASIIYTLYY